MTPTSPPTPARSAAERPRVGVGVLVWRHGRLLLGLRRGAHGAGTWACPGGHLEFGETPLACAARELAEETGLQALALHAGPFTSDVFEADGRHYVTLFIHATATSGEPRVTEPDKCERWDWFDPQALPQPLFAPVRSLLAQGPLAAP